MDVLLEKIRRDGDLSGMKLRPARALIGWMREREAELMLALPHTPAVSLPEHVERVKMAKAAVAARTTAIEQTDGLSGPGEELREYLTGFENDPHCKDYQSRGWAVKIAELQKVFALQAIVHVDYSGLSEELLQLTDGATQQDMLSVIKLTLPMPKEVLVPARFDQQNNAWIVQSNQNIKILGNFSARIQVAPGVFAMGYGFSVGQLPSFMQVVLYRGRYFLADGCHRALLLIKKGITRMPVLFREIPSNESLEVAGRFGDDTLLGVNPPAVADFIRDDVAAAGFHPTSNTTLILNSLAHQGWE